MGQFVHGIFSIILSRGMKFDRIERHQIDSNKWDECVRGSDNFRHYALTYFLDSTCEWIGLVYNDYESVWPLPVKGKLFKQVYQPLLAQQLGPFQKGQVLDSDLTDVLSHLRKNYWRHSIKLNNSVGEIEHYETTENINIELDLGQAYDSVVRSYKRTAVSNIKKATQNGLEFQTQAEFEPRVLQAFKLGRGNEIQILDEAFYTHVEQIYDAFSIRGEAETWSAYLNGEWIAGVMILKSQNRLLNFFTGTSSAAKNVGGSHFIIDQIIRAYAGGDWVFDFEGSNDENLGYFYRSFGGMQRIYLQVMSNWHFPI